MPKTNFQFSIFNSQLRKGFSLVELTIVLAIIGILAGFGTNSYLNSQKRGRDSKRIADLEVIRSALEQYRYDKGVYPPGRDNSALQTALVDDNNYLQSLPSDPVGNKTYCYTVSGSGYKLATYMEGTTWENVVKGIAPCGWNNSCGTRCVYQVTNP